MILILVCVIIQLSGLTLDASDPESGKVSRKYSPTGALLRSMALPAWGQIYTRSYIKAGIIGSLEVFLIYQTSYYWSKTSKYKDLYLAEPIETRSLKFQQYDRYKDLRNQHIWFLGITIFYSMFDAYVDAHLKNFNIDLTPDFDSENHAPSLHLSLTYHF